ncbi:hypothetical protein H5S40_02710 [Limosilactobacillus sp. RRLNB_1_1]|uniref:PRC-barrel domain-containing protein n=1 Tax=Limosilactobacillus albertensis TaxID=2759752 RepID=A0A7W3TR22_9LACO|nr:hypothetical protein [Limosilactobacillus albertensis]MBB1069081.1 hypothetical protein [Limosilactobacillus albertensis]MCD7117589.1 hypothetical protein [Limosilactobacillus albertensis]MCD7128994.1 hypothetical protein [Limosilactobacillus albertensis]
MDLSKFERQARGKVVFNDGQTLIGKIVDYTSSWDNDDEEAYLTIVPESGKLKGKYVECPEDEVKVAEYLDVKQ